MHSAFSVNVKERLIFSCALLDPKGRLLANAPHIPCTPGQPGHFCEIDFKKYSIQEGYHPCNHPLYGGSHLPDLTLLKGVFDTNHQPIGCVTNRAHHAEIGDDPCSMPPFCHKPGAGRGWYLVRLIPKKWKIQLGFDPKMLQSATHPTRDVSANIFDLEAMAALHAGELRLKEMVKITG
ncbi:MAG: hydantoinase B/oxoprolinase family protein [Saprospiraceae bacterium]|nr:hydantoinase B/oxoprolinase family protein [Saprospiraceae bacterium]